MTLSPFDPISITVCPICGARKFLPFGRRSDGIDVVRCASCGMGMVAERRADLQNYYVDYYYTGDGDAGAGSGSGYENYRLVAAHSLAWVAQLVRLLGPPGAALDVGAADGHLLRLLGPGYDRSAIEVNSRLRARCADSGIRVIGDDICAPRLLEEHRDSFDVVTAIAVLEHVADMRRALEQIRDLLTPTGVLIFEVPLISQTADNEVWFNSSLEHVFYPTVPGLLHLFDEVFGLPLIGGEVHLQGYAATFVGLATRSSERHAELGELWRVLSTTPIEDLAWPAQRTFRLLFDLVHAANSRADSVAMLAALAPVDLTPELLHRLGALWSRDLRRLAESESMLGRPSAEPATLNGEIDRTSEGVRRTSLLEELASARRSARHEIEASRDREAFLAARQRSAEGRAQSTVHHFAVRAEELASALARSEASRATLEAEAANLRDHLSMVRGSRSWRLVERVWTTRARWRERLRRVLQPSPRALPPAAALAASTSASAEHPPDPLSWPADRPLVSVVIPCYNYGRFVTEAIDSVLAQTFHDLEILVVDGGSDAETVGILRELRRPRTQIFYREGRHLVGDNRNYGIERARGRYICCLDADDMLRPTYLAKALYLLEQHAFDVVSTAVQAFGDRSDVYRLKRFPTLADMVEENQLATCAVFRRTLWEAAGGYQDAGTGANYYYEDWRLWIRFAALGARLANLVDEPLLLYRVHSDYSLSRQNRTVPDIPRQRAAILEFNRDVLPSDLSSAGGGPSALRADAGQTEGWLLRWQGRRTGQPTVILAIPFLIVGGAERLLSAVARHLATRDYRLIIVTTEYAYPHYGDATEWFTDATQEIFQLPRFLDRSHWRDFILALLATHDDALLWLTGSTVFYDLLPEIATRFPNMPIIDQLFNTVGHTANNRRHAERFTRILVENAEVADWLIAAGESPSRVVRIPSGVDLETYRPRPRSSSLLEQLGVSADIFLAGFSGRLAEEKDPLAFVDVARLCRSEPGMAFVLTGDGPLAGPTRERIAELGVGDRLHYLGQVPCVIETMATYDALVLPSRFDGRPLAAIESLALGIPVVASRVGALPDLIQDGVTGFLCDPGDVAAFAECLRWLAGHRSEHARMKLAARRFAERELGAKQMLERYESVLREALCHRGATAVSADSPALAAP